MKNSTIDILDNLYSRYPVLESCKVSIMSCVEILIMTFTNGNKLMTCGNGGSASDALHIVGELMKSFVIHRKLCNEERDRINEVSSNAEYLYENLQGALPAISLVSELALMTAFTNDVAADLNFAQQVYGYGKNGDVLLVISTSGNSKNIIYASEIAKMKGTKIIALTGMTGGKLNSLADVLINVPETETFKVQELHLPIYHAICYAIENEFFGN